jgi:hypothetical protein
MFDILDEVLIQYQSYSKQIFTIKNQYRDSTSQEEDPRSELEILRTQLSRIILDADDEIMQVHFDYFAKRLITLFQFYNTQCFESGNSKKEIRYHFLNQRPESWNEKLALDQYQQTINNMEAVI